MERRLKLDYVFIRNFFRGKNYLNIQRTNKQLFTLDLIKN